MSALALPTLPAIVSRWCVDGSLLRPASLQSAMEGTRIHSGRFRRRSETRIDSEPLIVTCIPRLFFRSGPSTVLWTIGTVIVDTVNRMLRGWSQPHISEKVLKVIPPTFADDNPSASISCIGMVRREMAARPDSQPRLVFARFRQAMFKVASSCDFAGQTPATIRAVHPQDTTSNMGYSSAVATCFPIDFIGAWSGYSASDKQSAPVLAGIVC
jgi:hypothetical protein